MAKVRTTEETLERWQDLSQTFDQILAKTCIPSAKTLIDNLDLNHPNLTVLDAGCGPCKVTPYLVSQAQSDVKLYLCDYTPNMVEFAKERVANLKCETNVSRQDNQALSFSDQSFDRYFSNLVLHIVPDADKMLSEAYRVLKPGGIAGFSVWGGKEKSNIFTVVPRLVAAKHGPQPQPEERSQFYLNDKANLRERILKAGFSHVVLWEVMNIKALTRGEAEDLRGYFSNNDLVSADEIMAEIYKILDSGTPIGFEALVAVAWK